MPDSSHERRMPTAEEAAEELLRRDAAEKSFHEFVKQAWHVIEPADFVDGWHIRICCEHLEAVSRNEIKTLVINIPPRSSKTLIISVMFPAWVWIKDPASRWLCASFSDKLSMDHNVLCRRLIESDWYRVRFGQTFRLREEMNTKGRFDNDAGGYRISTSVGGTVTGLGAAYLVCDDPNQADDSDTILESTNSWWDQAFSTRINDRRTGHKIVVQQRIHERDLTGHLLSKQDPDLVHLMLPLEFESSRRCVTVPLPGTGGKPWADPRKKDGEILWDRWRPEDVAAMKRDLTSQYAIAGQLQQRPAPGEGGIIKKTWFQRWEQAQLPKFKFILQSWDTALTADKKNAYCACTNWGVFDNMGLANVMLLYAWRDRLEYPELRKTAQQMARDYTDSDWQAPKKMDEKTRLRVHNKPDMILVEAKANGKSLIQDLHRGGILAHGFNPDKYGDKDMRVKLATPLIEGGRVWVCAKPPSFTALYESADLLLSQASLFPAGESRDLIDTMTQALLRLEASGWVQVPTDPPQVEADPMADQREAIY